MTFGRDTLSFEIGEKSQVGEARRLVSGLVASLGFSEAEAGNIRIVATELASNIVKHAGDGELLFNPIGQGEVEGLEIIALDRGPGMPNVKRCREDGYSTAGSAGTGMGAMFRLASVCDVYSLPGSGTGVLCRFFRRGQKRVEENPVVETGGIAVAMKGESICGDTWAVWQAPGRTAVIVADGLGHGRFAAEAADETIHAFRAVPEGTPAAILERAHLAARGTRGAAVAVGEITGGEVRHAGIGNIGATILGGERDRTLISHNGIVGHEVRKVRESVYPWPAEAILVMHSDGLKTRWSFDNLPGVALHHPSLIAGMLYRDFKRGRDDVTVVVCRATV